MFHPQDAVVTFSVNVLEDVPIVDFSGRRLFAAGIVTHLEIANLLPGHIHVGNEVTLLDLLMVNIHKDFHDEIVDMAVVLAARDVQDQLGYQTMQQIVQGDK